MKQLKIWYLASEVSPFAKTGGLGDVTGSFPKSLKSFDQEIRVIMPKYKIINERKYVLREVIRLKDIPVTLNNVTKTINVKSAFLPESKVQIYFVEIPEYFGRNELYSDKNSGTDFGDNAERFAYFCLGAIETLKILSWKPDIIHCNDWQTAFAPIYLKTKYANDPFFEGIKTIYTIHNFSYQGEFDKKISSLLDLGTQVTETEGGFLHDGKINLTKGAIKFSDKVTTVSPTYAEEIGRDKNIGKGLEKYIMEKGEDFTGILNGVDYSVWSPENDKFIPFRYGLEALNGKEQNKQALLIRANLNFQENVPVVGMISRLFDVKGFDLLSEGMIDLLEMGIQMVILGVGEKKIEKHLESLQKKYSKQLSLNKAFDETFAHMVEAGADIYLMPSKYEPCGLNQMYSMKYGTVPVVYKTGGLADTVLDIDTDNEKGNGFVFEKYTVKELVKVIKRAIKLYSKKSEWQLLQKRIMQQDFSWRPSTEKYLEVYESSLGEMENLESK